MQPLLIVTSFCRKTTLKKHIVRSHLQGAAGELSSNELEEELEEDESPSPVMQPQDIPYDRSYWGLPSQDQSPMPFLVHISPTGAPHAGQQIKREASMQTASFGTAPSRTTSNSSYGHYPHPENLSQGQIQNLTNAPPRTSTPMGLMQAPQGSYHIERPVPRIQTNMEIMHNFSSPNQVMPQPLQSSPSTMSSGSSGLDSCPPQEYRQEYSTASSYPSHSSYGVPHSQMSYPQMEPMSASQTYSMSTCSLPAQVQAPRQQSIQPSQFNFDVHQAAHALQYRAAIQQQQQEDQDRERQVQHQLQMQQMQQIQQQQLPQPQYTQHEPYGHAPYQEPEAVVEIISNGALGDSYYGPLWPTEYKPDEPNDMPSNVIPGWSNA